MEDNLDKQLFNSFRDELSDATMKPSAGVWKAVEKSLVSEKKIIPLWPKLLAVGVAASLVLLLFLCIPKTEQIQSHKTIIKPKNLAEKVILAPTPVEPTLIIKKRKQTALVTTKKAKLQTDHAKAAEPFLATALLSETENSRIDESDALSNSSLAYDDPSKNNSKPQIQNNISVLGIETAIAADDNLEEIAESRSEEAPKLKSLSRFTTEVKPPVNSLDSELQTAKKTMNINTGKDLATIASNLLFKNNDNITYKHEVTPDNKTFRTKIKLGFIEINRIKNK